jgi:hypothetical protein
MTRERAEHYRRLAEECRAQRTVSTNDVRAALVERAKYWLRLAQQQEDESAEIPGSMPPQSPVEDQPVVQQQQVQPKNDDKKE